MAWAERRVTSTLFWGMAIVGGATVTSAGSHGHGLSAVVVAAMGIAWVAWKSMELFMRRLIVQGINKIRIICRCLSHVSRRVGSDHNTLVCLTTPHVKPYRTYCLLLKVGPLPSNLVAEREGQGHSHLALHVRQAQPGGPAFHHGAHACFS